MEYPFLCIKIFGKFHGNSNIRKIENLKFFSWNGSYHNMKYFNTQLWYRTTSHSKIRLLACLWRSLSGWQICFYNFYTPLITRITILLIKDSSWFWLNNVNYSLFVEKAFNLSHLVIPSLASLVYNQVIKKFYCLFHKYWF